MSCYVWHSSGLRVQKQSPIYAGAIYPEPAQQHSLNINKPMPNISPCQPTFAGNKNDHIFPCDNSSSSE